MQGVRFPLAPLRSFIPNEKNDMKTLALTEKGFLMSVRQALLAQANAEEALQEVLEMARKCHGDADLVHNNDNNNASIENQAASCRFEAVSLVEHCSVSGIRNHRTNYQGVLEAWKSKNLDERLQYTRKGHAQMTFIRKFYESVAKDLEVIHWCKTGDKELDQNLFRETCAKWDITEDAWFAAWQAWKNAERVLSYLLDNERGEIQS